MSFDVSQPTTFPVKFLSTEVTYIRLFTSVNQKVPPQVSRTSHFLSANMTRPAALPCVQNSTYVWGHVRETTIGL